MDRKKDVKLHKKHFFYHRNLHKHLKIETKNEVKLHKMHFSLSKNLSKRLKNGKKKEIYTKTTFFSQKSTKNTKEIVEKYDV